MPALLALSGAAPLLAALPFPDDTARRAVAVQVVPYPWAASLHYRYDPFLTDRPEWPAWHGLTLALERRVAGGVVGLDLFREHRFGFWDEGARLNAHLPFWKGAYGSLRAQAVADADAMAKADLAIDLFQGLAAWEGSAGYRRIVDDEGGLDLYSASLARYTGRWYLRARAMIAPTEGAAAAVATVRRYRGLPTEFWEAAAAVGSEPVVLGAGAAVELRSTTAVSLRVRRYPLERLGVEVSARYRGYSGAPVRLGITVGLLARW